MKFKLPNAVSLLLIAIVIGVLNVVASELPGAYNGAYAAMISGILFAVAKAFQVYYEERKKAEAERDIAPMAEEEGHSRLREWLFR